MKIAQFLCFTPGLAEEEIANVHALPELLPCNRRPRRLLAGIVFPIFSRPQAIHCSASSSPSSRRSGRFCNRKPNFASETEPARKSISDDDLGSDEAIFSSSSSSSPKTSSSSSSFSSPIFPGSEAKEAEAAEGAERRCALCFLVVSLMVMVFCGRICAILWTASGFCFLPRRKPVAGSPDIFVAEMPVVTSPPPPPPPPAADLRRRGFYEDDKMRVVLEGFLGRNKRICEKGKRK